MTMSANDDGDKRRWRQGDDGTAMTARRWRQGVGDKAMTARRWRQGDDGKALAACVDGDEAMATRRWRHAAMASHGDDDKALVARPHSIECHT